MWGGESSGVYGWFYLSDSVDITPHTKWTFLNAFHSRDEKSLLWKGWENAGLVTECGTKDIYYVGSKRLKGSLLNTFRMGGGLHVTPQRKLLMYNVSRMGKRINEFR